MLVRESTSLGYLEMKKHFFHRLITWGYPPSFILRNFKNHPLSLRHTLLHKQRTKSSLTLSIFRLRYSKNTPNLGIRTLVHALHSNLGLDPQLKDISRPFICWTKSKNKLNRSPNPPWNITLHHPYYKLILSYITTHPYLPPTSSFTHI